MSYLEEVRALAIDKGMDPDEMEKSIRKLAIAAHRGVEDIAHSFLVIIQVSGDTDTIDDVKNG